MLAIKDGERVLDPMCGSGTALIEAVAESSAHTTACVFVGADISLDQLELCAENMTFAKFNRQIQVCR